MARSHTQDQYWSCTAQRFKTVLLMEMKKLYGGSETMYLFLCHIQ